MKRLLTGLLGIAAAATSAPASATQTVLTFDPATLAGAVPACSTTSGGPTNKTCDHVDYIGADYGSNPTLAVSYDPGGTAASLRAYVGYAGATSGGAFNWGGVEGADQSAFSQIVFTPAAGYLVSFRGVDFFPGSATQVIYSLEVRDAGNNLLAAMAGDATPGSFNPNTAYFAGPLFFRFSNTSGGLVIDNVVVDVIAAGAGGVPEPATWALMILGFGAVGGAMRRRRRSASRLAAIA